MTSPPRKRSTSSEWAALAPRRPPSDWAGAACRPLRLTPDSWNRGLASAWRPRCAARCRVLATRSRVSVVGLMVELGCPRWPRGATPAAIGPFDAPGAVRATRHSQVAATGGRRSAMPSQASPLPLLPALQDGCASGRRGICAASRSPALHRAEARPIPWSLHVDASSCGGRVGPGDRQGTRACAMHASTPRRAPGSAAIVWRMRQHA